MSNPLLVARLAAAAPTGSLRGWAREAAVSLSTAQRVLSGGSTPTLRTLTALGAVTGLRLELVPHRPAPGPARARAPWLHGASSRPLSWSAGEWLGDDVEYLLTLLGRELRHCRRYGPAGLRSADTVAAQLGILPMTLRRLERPTGGTLLPTVTAVAAEFGFTLDWLPRAASWRPRPWQLETATGRTGRARMTDARRTHGRHRAALMTSLEQTWTTPPELIAAIAAEFGPITLDAAAREGDQVAPLWLGPDHPDPARRDSLRFGDWADLAVAADGTAPHTYLNPPFQTSRPFVERAVATAAAGVPVTAVLPARVDTAVFQDLILSNAHAYTRFLRGRLRYGRGDGRRGEPAPFPSALVRFMPSSS